LPREQKAVGKAFFVLYKTYMDKVAMAITVLVAVVSALLVFLRLYYGGQL